MRGTAGHWRNPVRVPVLARLSLAVLRTSGCGGQQSGGPAPGPQATSSPTATPTSTRDRPLNRAAIGPWWGSGCPVAGDCGCGSSEAMAEEFTCQLDELRAADIPVTVYLFDGSGWSERDSKSDGTCAGSDCCSWNLGDALIERLSREHVRALVHSWGGGHEPEQYARVHSQLGGSVLGFYLDDGSSDRKLQRVNDFMRSVAPGDFERTSPSRIRVANHPQRTTRSRDWSTSRTSATGRITSRGWATGSSASSKPIGSRRRPIDSDHGSRRQASPSLPGRSDQHPARVRGDQRTDGAGQSIGQPAGSRIGDGGERGSFQRLVL